MSFYIRDARKAAKITQEELAKEIGVNRATLSKYESGTIEPSVSQLKKIAKVLKIENWTDLVDSTKAAQMVVEHIIKNIASDYPNASTNKPKKALPKIDNLSKRTDETIKRVGAETFLDAHKTLDDFLSGLGSLEDRLWYAFSVLNSDGQQKAVERVEELTEIPKYQRLPSPENPPESAPESPENK